MMVATPEPSPPLALVRLAEVLATLAPQQRRTFALACARHSLVALATDPRALPLLRALDHLPAAPAYDTAWATVTAHLWGAGGCGPARRALWRACYWALWPAGVFTAFAADQAAWYSRWARAEIAVSARPPGRFFAVERAEAAWQRALLTSLLSPSGTGSAPRQETQT